MPTKCTVNIANNSNNDFIPKGRSQDNLLTLEITPGSLSHRLKCTFPSYRGYRQSKLPIFILLTSR